MQYALQVSGPYHRLLDAAAFARAELDAHYEKRQTPRGTYDQVREVLSGFSDLGIERFYLQGVFTQTDMGKLFDGLGVA